MNFPDIATGYKISKKEIIKEIDITSNGFEIEPEITAKFVKIKKLIYLRFPYQFIRRYDEGKKVRWWDFFIYIYTLLKWRIF